MHVLQSTKVTSGFRVTFCSFFGNQVSVNPSLIIAQFRRAQDFPNSYRAERCVGLTNELPRFLQWEVKFPELLTLRLSATSDQESCSLTSTGGSSHGERKRQIQGEKLVAFLVVSASSDSRDYTERCKKAARLFQVVNATAASRDKCEIQTSLHPNLARLLPNGSADLCAIHRRRTGFAKRFEQEFLNSDKHLKQDV